VTHGKNAAANLCLGPLENQQRDKPANFIHRLAAMLA
jgi:hypothetical protein